MIKHSIRTTNSSRRTKNKFYACPANKLTIGVGRNLEDVDFMNLNREEF